MCIQSNSKEFIYKTIFFLVINAMKNIILSFNTGYIHCNSRLEKKLAEIILKLNIDNIVQASRRKQAGLQTFFLMKQIVSFIMWKHHVLLLHIQIKQQKCKRKIFCFMVLFWLAISIFYIYTLQ